MQPFWEPTDINCVMAFLSSFVMNLLCKTVLIVKSMGVWSNFILVSGAQTYHKVLTTVLKSQFGLICRNSENYSYGLNGIFKLKR